MFKFEPVFIKFEFKSKIEKFIEKQSKKCIIRLLQKSGFNWGLCKKNILLIARANSGKILA